MMTNPLHADRLVVTAGAGAGKTTMLVNRYVFHVADQKLSPLQVVAVTFTEAAAAELKARIRVGLGLTLGEDDDRLAELEAARICTFHSLAAAICRQHPLEAGVPAGFEILDEVTGRLWLAERMNDALDRLPSRLFTRIPYTVMRKLLRRLLADPTVATEALSRRWRHSRNAIETARTAAREALLNSPEWRELSRFIESVEGPALDLIEVQRRMVADGMRAFQAGDVEGLRAVAGAKIVGGKQANWTVPLAEVKGCITQARSMAAEALKEGVIDLQAGPADAAMLRRLGDLRRAYRFVAEELKAAKQRDRMLDYADLEIHALRALQNPTVRAYYHERWRAFLVDEFQDTNLAQVDLLNHLIHDAARVAVVGDENQSIYGFRRADPALFRAYHEKMERAGGTHHQIAANRRSNRVLVDRLNSVFGSVFCGNGQRYSAQVSTREAPSPETGAISWYQVTSEEGVPTTDSDAVRQRRAEALRMAQTLRRMFDEGVLVHDRNTGAVRRMRWGDVAILTRAWDGLDAFADAFGSLGIPYVHAGGGNLLATREARDGYALLRFLADPADDVALAGVLKSPFCSASDINLYHLAMGRGDRTLWEALSTSPGLLAGDFALLRDLVELRETESPGHLLHVADIRSGYSAILANLPASRRRVADWEGFCDMVRKLERDSHDAFGVARTLRMLDMSGAQIGEEVMVPRPSLEAGDAVSLMTIHRSKGLEWPVVVVADLARTPRASESDMLVEPDLGVALKHSQDEAVPCLFRLLASIRRTREALEEKRLLYVASTRARDYLLLSSTAPRGASYPLRHLEAALEAAGVTMQPWIYEMAHGLPPDPPQPERRQHTPKAYLGDIEVAPAMLPVTGLSAYRTCPRRFRYSVIEGHPGVGMGSSISTRVGTLVHLAIEHAFTEEYELQSFDRGLNAADVRRALMMADIWRTRPQYARFARAKQVTHEQAITTVIGGVTLSGRIDLLGPGFVVDFKTGDEALEESHLLQLWVYGQATGAEELAIAYLRRGGLVVKQRSELAGMEAEVSAILEGITQMRFEPTPSLTACTHCPYRTICDHAAVKD